MALKGLPNISKLPLDKTYVCLGSTDRLWWYLKGQPVKLLYNVSWDELVSETREDRFRDSELNFVVFPNFVDKRWETKYTPGWYSRVFVPVRKKEGVYSINSNNYTAMDLSTVTYKKPSKMNAQQKKIWDSYNEYPFTLEFLLEHPEYYIEDETTYTLEQSILKIAKGDYNGVLELANISTQDLMPTFYLPNNMEKVRICRAFRNLKCGELLIYYGAALNKLPFMRNNLQAIVKGFFTWLFKCYIRKDFYSYYSKYYKYQVCSLNLNKQSIQEFKLIFN